MNAAIILVNFEDNTDSPPDYITTLNTTTIPQTNSFYQEVSYGRASLTAKVFGWFTLPIPATCDFHAINLAFRAVTPAPVDLSAFNRVVYVLPQSACGGVGVSGGDGTFMSPPSTGTLAHELGHTLGLGHANSWDCGSVIFDPFGGCVWIEYGNPYDVMGSVNLFHFNADFKDYFGWLSPQVVATTGVYELDPLELSDSKVKAIKIPYTLNGQTLHYWLEYRRPVGFDAVDWTGATPNFDGIMINVDAAGVSGGYVSFLLDVDPSTPPNPAAQRQISPLLRLNEVFVDPASGVRITPVSLTSASAMVSIEVPSPAPSAPMVSLTSPSPGSVVSEQAPLSLVAQAVAPNDLVAKVEFMDVNQTLFKIGESDAAPYSFDWQTFPTGPVSLLARVVSSNGLIAHSPIVTISVNQPPQVGITSPPLYANIPAGTPLTVTASTSDADGSVAKVEFFDGATSVGAKSSAPFSVQIAGLSAGAHFLTAVATDNRGAQTTSGVVPVSVYPAAAITSTAVFTPSISVGTASLSVLGGPNATESTLTYEWQSLTPVNGTVSFNPNGNNSAKTTTATFSQPGTYNIQVAVTDPNGNAILNSLSVPVLPPDHSYTIKIKHSGLCVDLQQRSASPATDIIQDACGGSMAQLFQVEPTIDSSFSLVSDLTGFCFDMPYGNLNDNVHLNQYPCNFGDNQRYLFLPIGDGSFELQNVPSGKCLTVPNADMNTGVALVQLPCMGTPNQSFLFGVSDQGNLKVMTSGLPDTLAGTPYYFQFLASGGKGPYTWSVASGSLPFGLSLSPAGTLTGSPLLVNSWANTVSISVTVTDAAGSRVTSGFGLKLTEPDPFAPTISPGGIVSAAAVAVPLPAIPAGGFISIYGTNLAPSPATAVVPFPEQLNGVSVSLANRPLPIAYVGDNVINAIVPYDVPPNTQQRLYVSSNGRTSIGQTVTVAAYQPSIFTMTESGSGQGAVTNAITGVLAQPGTPVGVGDVISIYCAGLGPVSPSVAAGIAAPSGPQLSWTVLPTVVTIGGVDAQVTFSGLAPTLAGVYQVNAIVPAGLSPGDAVPVTLTIEGMPSPPVTISIR